MSHESDFACTDRFLPRSARSDARLNWTEWAGLPMEEGQMPAVDIDARPAPLSKYRGRPTRLVLQPFPWLLRRCRAGGRCGQYDPFP
jgi:hypothetical protein